MNIFFLDNTPHGSAIALCDKHVVKMCLETAQMLSTAHRELQGDDCDPRVYKSTHKNHPSTVWVRTNRANYRWAFDLFASIAQEYTHRYNKVHLCWHKLATSLWIPPSNCPEGSLSPVPQCMPDEYKSRDPIEAYRHYYIGEKLAFAKWTNRNQPEWIK